MADSLYPIGIVGIMNGDIDLLTNDIVVLLVTSSYTFAATHDDIADAVAAELSGTGYSRKTLASKTVTRSNSPIRGVFDAADITWAGINAGAAAALIIAADLGADSASPLLVYIDSGGFPITTNGGDLAVAWAAGGIFYL